MYALPSIDLHFVSQPSKSYLTYGEHKAREEMMCLLRVLVLTEIKLFID